MRADEALTLLTNGDVAMDKKTESWEQTARQICEEEDPDTVVELAQKLIAQLDGEKPKAPQTSTGSSG